MEEQLQRGCVFADACRVGVGASIGSMADSFVYLYLLHDI